VHDAQLLYLMSRHFPRLLGSAPPSALETMSEAISANRTTSLSAAYTLLALDAYAKTAAPGTLAISEIAKDGKEHALTLPSSAMPKVAVSESAAKLQFARQGAALAYFALNETGFDRNTPTKEINQGIEVFREFLDMNGNPITRATVGQELLVRLRLRTTGRDYLPQVAVVDLLPAGVEPVVELRPAADSSANGVDPALARNRATGGAALPIGIPARSNWRAMHVDVRDDRVLLYGDVTKDAGTFVYRVRATSAGTFQVPPAFAEGMYNRTVTGLSPAGKLEIVKP